MGIFVKLLVGFMIAVCILIAAFADDVEFTFQGKNLAKPFNFCVRFHYIEPIGDSAKEVISAPLVIAGDKRVHTTIRIYHNEDAPNVVELLPDCNIENKPLAFANPAKAVIHCQAKHTDPPFHFELTSKQDPSVKNILGESFVRFYCKKV